MQLHDKNSKEENRLIILYLYNKMFMPLRDAFVDEFFYNRDWMTYFDMKSYIIDLLDDGYLEEHENMKRITSKGLFVLDNFKTDIPFSIREEIDNYVVENKQKVMREMEIYANYSQKTNTEFPVELKLYENNLEVLVLRIVAPSRKEASELCDKFRDNADEIYARIITEMTKDE